MKISLEWLRQYLPKAPDAHICGEALTMAGLPTENFEVHGADTVLDVEVTSNRGDCLSHLGVARELGALLRLDVTELASGPEAARSTSVDGVKVAVEDPTLCPVYTARVIRGAKVGPSPAWMVRRLEACGLRAVNNVVDVTNYVLFELGQPLHAFDLRQLQANQLVVRRARAGESLTSIDGHVRKLTPDMLVIADAGRAVALAGVMGGKDSEVSAGTTDILLESAVFDPLSVRKTSRSLQLRSDSSHRFERGIPLSLPEAASARAAELIVELAGGTLSRELAVAGKLGAAPKPLALRLASIRRTLGIEVSAEAAADALSRLRFRPKISGDSVEVEVPADRMDVNVEIDLVEEVARVIGYEQIPLREAISITVTPPQRPQKVMEKVRSVLVGSGYFEAITFSFVADGVRDAILPPEAAGLPRALHGVRKADGSLRPSCLPGLMEAQRRNEAAGTREVRLFEVGSTFYLDGNASLVERRKLALLTTDEPRQLRGVVEQLLATLDSGRKAEFAPVSRKGYFRAVEIRWGGQAIGLMGVADAALSAKLDLRVAPSIAEIEIVPLIEMTRLVPQLTPLPRFPAVERDLSLVVEDSVRFAEIESLISGLKLANLEACQFVTTYRGKPLEKGKKSVTVKLLFRRVDGTLTAEEADASVQMVVERAVETLAATLRT
jgi:phenylalanyl-tRNA synthetase beta chain